MNEADVKDIIAQRMQTFKEFEKAAEEMAGYASERAGMKVTKKDVMYGFIELADLAAEESFSMEDLLFAICEKMDKEDIHE